MPMRLARQMLQALQSKHTIIIVPHREPDGDALGSATALLLALEAMGKDCRIVCATDASPHLNIIPQAHRLSSDSTQFHSWKPDAIIVVDSGDLAYAGVETHIQAYQKRPLLINIDHHATNKQFGDYNIVDTAASSTCEIVYHIFKNNHITITQDIALCLLTGIVTDTGNFSNGATTPAALRAASDLIHYGANLSTITAAFFRDSTVDALRLWGRVLGRMNKHEKHNFVYTYITAEDMKEFDVPEHKVDGIANFLNILEEGYGALVLKEIPGVGVKGSFRTTKDTIDVSAIAKALGGGGHKKASGFTISGTIEEAFKYIWEVMDLVVWNAAEENI